MKSDRIGSGSVRSGSACGLSTYKDRGTGLSTTLLYLCFGATGVCMALPGAVLPALLNRWDLADSQAGMLFFIAWMGSSLGALLVRKPIARSLSLGNLALATACLGITQRSNQVAGLRLFWMGLFGIGLGLTMTATTLIRTRRQAENRGRELNRLNLTWSVGAFFTPLMAKQSLIVVDVRFIFGAVSVFFAFMTLWAIFGERYEYGGGPGHDSDQTTTLPGVSSQTSSAGPIVSGRMSARLGSSFRRSYSLGASLKRVIGLWPISLVAAILLPTGIESSAGGWIAVYVERGHHSVAATVSAGTCFWGGLMLSRVLSSVLLRNPRLSRPLLIQSIVTVLLGISLLIALTSTTGVLTGAFLTGFGVGPLYPLLLAIALQYSENAAIFFVAGVGSAALPWLTGELSSVARSLRIGLSVPLVASLLLAGLVFRLSRGESRALVEAAAR